MSGPLQTLPQGMLGFFQLKNAGKNPTDMPEVLQPVLELRDWYFQTNNQIMAGTDTAIAAAGTFAYLTVPAGRMWAVHDVAITGTVAVASTVFLQPTYFSGGPGSPLAFHFPLTSEPFRWDEALQGATLVLRSERVGLLLLPPGGGLGIRVLSLSAAMTANNVVARISEFVL